MAIKVGDWVQSYSKGIWQIVREVPEHYEPRYSLTAALQLSTGPHFLLKRLVNDQWKPAFAMEAPDASFVKRLTKVQERKLERLLADNQELVTQFASFVQPIDRILNLPFSLTRKADFRPFQETFEQAFAKPLQRGMTGDAILKAISDSAYSPVYCQNPRNATLQFVCQDHEVRRSHFVYRKLNIHKF